MIVKYNDEDIEALDITVNSVMDAMDSATFSLPNEQNDIYDDWSDVLDEEITIEIDSEEIFVGYISNVKPEEEYIYFEVLGAIVKLTWYYLNSLQTNLRILEGIVETAPASTDLELYFRSVKDEFPKLIDGSLVSDDIFNNDPTSPCYLIVSDASLGISEFSDSPTSADSGDYYSGSYSDMEEQDGESYIAKNLAVGDDDFVYIRCVFDLGENIPNTAKLQQLRISLVGNANVKNDSGLFGGLSYFKHEIYWKSGNAGYDEYYLESKTKTVERYDDYDFNIAINTGWINISEDDEAWFNDDGSYWDKGYLYIKVTKTGHYAQSPTDTDDITISIDYAKIELKYDSQDFDEINQKISNTERTLLLKCYLQCYDDENVPDNFDFGSRGIIAGDSIIVCSGLNEGINRCFQKVELTNNIVTVDKGISQKYDGMDQYDLLTQLLESEKIHWWVNYSEDIPSVEGDLEENIAAATFTYDANHDPPSKQPKIEIPNNEYGKIVVQYANGTTPPIQAASPSSNPKTKIVQADWIQSLTEAINYAESLAEYYSTTHKNIQYTWNYLPSEVPQVGAKYNLELYKWDGSTTRDTFTLSDQICRRVTINYSDGMYEVNAFFGGGHTPASEKQGMILGRLERYNRINRSQNRAASIESAFTNLSTVTVNAPLTISEQDISLSYLKGLELDEEDNLQVTLSEFDTDDLAESETNLYHTSERVETIITAELVDGQSIDLAIDALIATHASNASAHHEPVTLAEGAILTLNTQELDLQQSDIDHTQISNVGDNSHETIDDFIASKGEASGLASLDSLALLERAQIPGYLVSGMYWKGSWDASAGTFPSTTELKNGDFYECSVAGTINGISYEVGDRLIYNDDIGGFDYISDFDQSFEGYQVRTAKLIANKSVTKYLQIRNTMPWELNSILSFGYDFDELNYPENWSVTNSPVITVTDEDNFEKIMVLVGTTTTGGSSVRYEITEHEGVTTAFVEGWIKFTADGGYSPGIQVEIKTHSASIGFVFNLQYYDASNIEYWIYRISSSTSETHQTEAITPTELFHFAFKVIISSGTGTGYVHLNGNSSPDYTSAGTENFGANEINDVYYLAAAKTDNEVYSCAIASNVFNSNASFLKTYRQYSLEPVIDGVLESTDTFSDSDTKLMTAKALDDRYLTLSSASSTYLTQANAASTYQPILTNGILNTNNVIIDSANVEDNDFAKFTSNGLEGRAASEVISDLGITATAAELNYCDGVTSNIQTQLNAKMPLEEDIYFAQHYRPRNGFTLGAYYKTAYYVANSDGAADLDASVYVKEGGTFKVRIVVACHLPTNIGTVAITTYASSVVGSWNELAGDAYTLTLQGQTEVTKDSDDSFSVSDNTLVGLSIHKGNSSDTTGNFYIFYVALVRQ